MSLTWGKVRDFDYQHLAQWAECQVSGSGGIGRHSEFKTRFFAGSNPASPTKTGVAQLAEQSAYNRPGESSSLSSSTKIRRSKQWQNSEIAPDVKVSSPERTIAPDAEGTGQKESLLCSGKPAAGSTPFAITANNHIHLAGTTPRNSGKSEGSPVELPSVFSYPWKAFLVGICFWAAAFGVYKIWK